MANEQDLIWAAVAEALAPVRHQEAGWERGKLERRVREYFRKAARGLEYNTKSWHALIGDYADAVFASLFQALGDRPWLAQADLLLVLDAGVRDNFPPELIANVPRLDFERAVLVAHDRAFEEQRYLPVLWESIQSLVQRGGKSGKKVYDAAELGRRSAAQLGSGYGDPNEVKAFVSKWVDTTLAHLSRTTQGDPSSVLPEEVAVQLFHALLEAGALPLALAAAHGPPPSGWPFVDYAVHTAYVAHGSRAEGGCSSAKGRGGRAAFSSQPCQAGVARLAGQSRGRARARARGSEAVSPSGQETVIAEMNVEEAE
mmetsp:Transcript_73367/g.228120  ORF Transcript_73367/g.228120 Transcript_73367/m.228120 type:complete len:314 (+) Transcript_73367:31-972(+)